MRTLLTLTMLLCGTIFFAQDQIYVHTADTDNINSNWTLIDHPDLNNNPAAELVYNHVWNPNGGTGVYNDNATGLWYNSGAGQWTIYNEDQSPMIEGTSYNILITDPANVITHVATAANQGSFGAYTTAISDSRLDSDPGPFAVLSTYYNPNFVYNPNQYAFYYDTALGTRGIYESGATAIPDGAAFKILITGDGTTNFSHTATAANISGNYTIIDNTNLNGNPNATFVFSHYWGVNGTDSQVDLDQNLGAWYDGTNWSIYTEDPSANMPENIVFDIMVAPQEVLGVTDLEIAQVSLSPNPVANKMNIVSTKIIDTIVVYDILGKEVTTTSEKSDLATIDMSPFSPGVYLATITSEGTSQTIQFVKQ